MSGTTYSKGQKVWIRPGYSWLKGRVVGVLNDGRVFVRYGALFERKWRIFSAGSLDLMPR